MLATFAARLAPAGSGPAGAVGMAAPVGMVAAVASPALVLAQARQRVRQGREPWWSLRALPAKRLAVDPDRAEAEQASDNQLVAAAKYGDPDAFDLLVVRFTPVLHAVARRLVGDELARDVVQDSLLAAYRNLSRYRGEASFGSYLHGIVVNRCRRVGPRWWQPTAATEELDLAASPEAGPAELSERSDTLSRVEAALRQLPAPFREALTLREFGALGYDEIADALGVPVGTVRSRLARARSLLRDELARVGVRP